MADTTFSRLIDAQRQTSFREPDTISDARAAGVLLARHFEYDGAALLEMAEAALTDANFHSEAEVVARLAERWAKDDPNPSDEEMSREPSDISEEDFHRQHEVGA